MPKFDRFDICEAHYVLECDWHDGGILQERPTNRRMNRSTGVQLDRMQFTPSPSVRNNGYDALTDNGKEIYNELERRYGFRPTEFFGTCDDCGSDLETCCDGIDRCLECNPCPACYSGDGPN